MRTYYPLTYIRTFGSGANKPILVRAVNEDGVKDDIVVKLLHSERMNTVSFMKEAVGGLIAKKLNINTPTPCIANIQSVFVQSVRDSLEHNRILNSQGLNYGSLYTSNLQILGKHDILPVGTEDAALKIFYFDLLIQNPDRTIRVGKTNLFTTGDDLWVLDHEIAFSFLEVLFKPQGIEPWQFSDVDIQNMIRKHVLFDKIRRRNLNFEKLEGLFDTLDDSFWEMVFDVLPPEWISSEINEIITHVNAVKDNQVPFLKLTKQLLS